MTRVRLVLVLVAVSLAWAVPVAHANDSGRWLLTGASSVPLVYWQGLTSDPADQRIFFVGVFEGLWRTTPMLEQTAGMGSAIPPEVKAAEGYNHIGDPSWDPGEGGRVLLPLECFTPGVGNTCGTGSIGVADPATLGFRYYVKLDPAEIPKAMWAETSPDGTRVWTSSGADLLTYDSADVSPLNAAPAAPPIRAAGRLVGAVPPSGVTGAVFRHGRLLLAGQDGGVHQVWSVNPANGTRRLEIEMDICGEAEGLDTFRALGGRLHWLIAPFDPGCELTFGPSSALLHFVPRRGRERLDVRILSVAGEVPGTIEVKLLVKRHGRPLRHVRVSFAGGHARSSRWGVARVSASLKLPGRFKVLARKGGRYGLSTFVELPGGPVPRPQSAPASNGAG